MAGTADRLDVSLHGPARRQAAGRLAHDRAPPSPARSVASSGSSSSQDETIHLPIRVSIDAHGIGGPSAGLAFALEVLQQLGRNVDHGHKIAATGEISLNGRWARSAESSRRRSARAKRVWMPSSSRRARTRPTPESTRTGCESSL